MKLETTKRRLALEKKRLRGAISRVVTRVEEGTSRTAVKCVLKELEAQYAEAYRAQVAVEGALPDGDELDAVQERSFYDMQKQPPKPQLGKLQPVPLPKFDGDILQFKSFWDQFEASVDRREDLGAITKLLHLRSCLSGAALKAIEGITVCAENYPEVVRTLHSRFHRVPDVVESHVLSVMNVKACSNEGAGELTRLHDDLNRHFLELKALGKDVNCCLSGFHDTDLRTRTTAPSRGHQHESHLNARKPEVRFTTAAVQMESGGGCPVCKGDHLVDRCPRFRSYSVQQRRHWAMRLKLRFVFLGRGHRRERCPKSKSNQFWNVLLTGDSVPVGKARTKHASSAVRSDGTDSAEAKASISRSQTTIRLPVVRALAHGEKGKSKLVNCLLDSGSERSLIRTEVEDELDLQGPTSAMTVKGVNGLHVRIADARRVRFRLTPIPSKALELFKEGVELTAFSLPRLCDDLVATPTPWFCKDEVPPLLANEIATGRVQIDIISMLQVFPDHLWMDCVWTDNEAGEAVACEETILLAQTEDRLSQLLRRFWEVEALGILPSIEDAKSEAALAQFEESVSFDGQRYSVGLLWKADASPLPNNLEIAKRRLRSLTNRLARDPDKEREYAAVIQTYLDNGWAEQVEEIGGPPGRTWYLPHQQSTSRINGKPNAEWSLMDQPHSAGPR
ncbi:hypothetical protein T4D_10772, partial [Trichinella pseudospiralis]